MTETTVKRGTYKKGENSIDELKGTKHELFVSCEINAYYNMFECWNEFRETRTEEFHDIIYYEVVPFLEFREQRDFVLVSRKFHEKRSKYGPIWELHWLNGDFYFGHINELTKKPHGFGKIQIKCVYVGGKLGDSSYEGQWIEGKKTGRGCIRQHGHEYKGMVTNGKAHGKGKWTYSGGDTVESHFLKGKSNGWTISTTKDGDYCSEMYRDGQSVGIETHIYPEGHEFVGIWNEKGTMTYRNGDVYEGQWNNHHPTGTGRMTYKNGDVYEGYWTFFNEGYFDHRHLTSGTMTYKNGDIYEGNWRRTGFYVYDYECPPSSNNHRGNWRRAKRHGHGTLTYKKSKSCYVGGWSDGKQDGKGKLIRYNGTVIFEGSWCEGKMNRSMWSSLQLLTWNEPGWKIN